MKLRLTEAGFKEAADSLGVDVASIKAVAEVESRGNGFLPDGRPVILFERHKFHKYTQGLFSADHPEISNPKSGGYGRSGTHQWDRYEEAYDLDPNAAMKSASFGKFQIMGFNFREAGFKSVSGFVEAMTVSEDEQLKAFVNFVKANGLADELKRKDWAGFARGYNGEDYKKNDYDTKLATAYRKYSKVREDSRDETPAEARVTAGENAPEPVVEQPKDPPPKEINAQTATTVNASKPSVWGQISSISIPAGLTTILATVGKVFMGIPPWVWGLLIVVGIVVAAYLWNEKRKRAHERTLKIADIAADPNSNNVYLGGGENK